MCHRMHFLDLQQLDRWLNGCVHFVVEIQRFVCDRATPPIIEKLRKSIKWTWAEPLKGVKARVQSKVVSIIASLRRL